jgi:hypothetical protein
MMQASIWHTVRRPSSFENGASTCLGTACCAMRRFPLVSLISIQMVSSASLDKRDVSIRYEDRRATRDVRKSCTAVLLNIVEIARA